MTTLTAKYKPYPAYKPSGVEWLREIPAHWQIKRLKYAAALNPRASEVRKLPPDTEVSFVPMEAIAKYGGLDLSLTRELSDVADGYTYFSNGDVLVAKITPCFENGKGSLASELVNGIAFGTTELHVLRCRPELDKQYAFYLTLAEAFRKLGEAEMYGAGGQKRVPESFVTNLRHPLPPLPEQRAIAEFLDRETARIDALLSRKERLIELLQEKRTALISRAVTRGLDPNAPMRDSGVEWLGEIPAHWEVKRLWHLTPPDRRIMYGIVLPGPHIEDGVPIVKGGDVSPERLRLNLLSRTAAEIECRYERSRLHTGDLVYAIRGSIGDVAMIPGELEGANLTQDAARVGYGKDTSGLWLLYLLKSYAVFSQLEVGALGATIRGINIRDLKRTLIPVPPLSEQQDIADYVESETAKLDALVAKVQEAIGRLKELRTALISAAVTGRIDVQEEAG